jgi:hypothetical protein
MPRCRVDTSIERVEMEGFAFPLGVYPIEPVRPKPGYTITFEPADGDTEAASSQGASGIGRAGGIGGGAGAGKEEPEEEGGGLAEGGEGGEGEGGEWEEWPDRYVFDILVPATRVEALCRSLFAILPGRIFPILDVLGQDEYREIDPYVSYDLIGLERFLDALRRYSGFFYEDGLVGFGAMSEEPFIYVFVDEHKIVTVRAETSLREKVEAVLAAFDLEEINELVGADAATHEHRGVLDTPEDRRDLLNAEEIVEELRDDWRLVLNVDPESNTDDDGNDLGVTGWRCLVRHDWEIPPNEVEASKAAVKKGGKPTIGRYAEVYLTADRFREAEELAMQQFRKLLPKPLSEKWDEDEEAPDVPLVIAADRLTPEHFTEDLKQLGGGPPDMEKSRVWYAAWQPIDPP